MATTNETPNETMNETTTNETTEKETTPRTPEHKDGIYTEFDVELANGVRINVEVITDDDNLPARFSEMAFSGNFEGAILAKLTPFTRKVIDLAGASRKDLREVLAPIVDRANELEQA